MDDRQNEAGIGHVLSPPLSSPFGPLHLSSLWGSWTNPMHMHAGMGRYAFGEEGHLSTPPHLPPSLFHPSISVSFSYRRTLISGRRPMHVHVAVRRYAFRQERYPLPLHLFLLSLPSVHLRPISLIGAPSFLDGDPCMCMSPWGGYAYGEEKYLSSPHLPPSLFHPSISVPFLL